MFCSANCAGCSEIEKPIRLRKKTPFSCKVYTNTKYYPRAYAPAGSSKVISLWFTSVYQFVLLSVRLSTCRSITQGPWCPGSGVYVLHQSTSWLMLNSRLQEMTHVALPAVLRLHLHFRGPWMKPISDPWQESFPVNQF